MSHISSILGHLPGMGGVVENYEAAFAWGLYPRYYASAYIDSATVDAGNTPTTTLRMGLLLGRKIGTGTWTNYSPINTDGSEVAQGVLPIGLRMLDVVTGVAQTKYWAVMVSGGLQAAKVLGLDAMARAQMAKMFIFDDDLPGKVQFPWQRFQTKVANYQIVATDNLSLFLNTGAAGEVDLTLPAIANGYFFGLHAMVAQVFKFISNEGGNLIGDTATRTSASVTAIGGGLRVFSNPGASAWIIVNDSSYNQVVSFA